VEPRRRIPLAGEAIHPDPIADEKMVERPVHRLEEGAVIGAILGIGELRRSSVEPRIGPGIGTLRTS
jgi:hypothetical protein